ncbi:allantoin racemase [Kushneria sinocarnis]|uniref:Allantoin racemase n=1 Tax=Kushneria sinocarnis TaxID=595502 RepID=A0A420X174_9GAMM|nr:aspartate/glutamate racemase family protein [Kushneria sinocarnis]RKR07500.1 allantoin racemase [Kushneria sinocarnis]
MTLVIINPNTSTPMSERIGASARRAAHGDVHMLTSRHGPASLEGHMDEALAVPGLLERIHECEQDDSLAVSGYLIACFGDPGLAAARELASVPVLGMAEAGMHMASLVSARYSIVTTLARTLPIAERLLGEYGQREHCAGLHACELPVAALEEESDAIYRTLLEACRQALDSDASDGLLLGCAGMTDLATRLGDTLGVPVIDGVTAGVTLLESLERLGLTPAKHHDRALPLAKPIAGAFAHLTRSDA